MSRSLDKPFHIRLQWWEAARWLLFPSQAPGGIGDHNRPAQSHADGALRRAQTRSRHEYTQGVTESSLTVHSCDVIASDVTDGVGQGGVGGVADASTLRS